MMKLVFIAFLLFSALSQNLAQQRFLQFVPGWNCTKVMELDNHYIAAGLETNQQTNAYETIFSKLTKTGVVLEDWIFQVDSSWETGFSKTNSVYGSFICMNTDYPSINEYSGLLTKFTNDYADTIFTKKYRLDGLNTFLYTINSFDDSTFVLSFDYINAAGTNFSISLVRTDTLGNFIWRSNFYITCNYCRLKPYHVCQANDGGYLISCKEDYSAGVSGDEYYYTIIKTNATGQEQWRKRVGNTDYLNEVGWIVPKTDSTYLVAWGDYGQRISNLVLPYDTIGFIISEMDEQGNFLWSKKHANVVSNCDTLRYSLHNVKQMEILPDGNYLVSTLLNLKQSYLFKISPEGEIIWKRYISLFEEENADAGFSATWIKGFTLTSDGGIICAGEFLSSVSDMFPVQMQSGFVLKLDEYGCLKPDCHLYCPLEDTIVASDTIPTDTTLLEEPYTDYSIYPNPTNSEFTLQLSDKTDLENVFVQVIDLLGKVVLEQQIIDTKTTISTQNMSIGIYTLIVFRNGRVLYTNKLLKN